MLVIVLLLLQDATQARIVHIAFMAPQDNLTDTVDYSAGASAPGIACAVRDINSSGLLPDIKFK